MKKIKYGLIGMVLIVIGLLGIPSSEAVNKVIGIAGACPTNNASCFPFPANASIICSGLINQPTCPRVFHPSWSNGNRLWGVSSTNAAACVTSTDAGLTWVTCTTQAFVPIQQNIAEASDGTIIAVADVAGTCTVRTSPDNAATWNTVFTNPGIACGGIGATAAQLVYCQSTGGQCDFGTGTGANARTYRSTNNGAGWVVSAIGDALADISHGIEMNSALIGGFGAGIATGQKATYSSAGAFVVSAAWPGSAAAYLGSYPLMFGSAPQYINGSGTATWTRTDADGNILQSFSPTGAQGIGAVANPGLRAINWSGGQYYIVGPTTTGLGIWITSDSFVSTVLIYSKIAGNPGVSSSRYTMYKVGGKILISANDGGANAAFFRVI